MKWNRSYVGGIKKEMKPGVEIEPFDELFDAPGSLAPDNTATFPKYNSWRLYAAPSEPLLDGIFHRTPERVREIYRPIVADSLPPSAHILAAVDAFDAKAQLAQRLGVHIRTRFDSENRPYADPAKIVAIHAPFIKMNSKHWPLYLATDSAALRSACEDMENVLVLPNIDMRRMVVGQWAVALTEMLALARCRFLMVTKGSTFSECAWWLGGARQKVITVGEPAY